jgi:hypothetical protein
VTHDEVTAGPLPAASLVCEPAPICCENNRQTREPDDLLVRVNELLELQREAILAQDSGRLNELCELMRQCLPAEQFVGAGSPPLQHLRDRLRTNQVLMHQGLANSDHFITCVEAARPTAGPLLLSEVA